MRRRSAAKCALRIKDKLRKSEKAVKEEAEEHMQHVARKQSPIQSLQDSLKQLEATKKTQFEELRNCGKRLKGLKVLQCELKALPEHEAKS